MYKSNYKVALLSENINSKERKKKIKNVLFIRTKNGKN